MKSNERSTRRDSDGRRLVAWLCRKSIMLARGCDSREARADSEAKRFWTGQPFDSCIAAALVGDSGREEIQKRPAAKREQGEGQGEPQVSGRPPSSFSGHGFAGDEPVGGGGLHSAGNQGQNFCGGEEIRLPA